MYGYSVARVELHALGALEIHAELWPFLEFDHSSLPYLVDRVAITSADSRVRRPRSGATEAIWLPLPEISTDCFSMFATDVVDGRLDVRLDSQAGWPRRRRFFRTLANDRLGRTVAVVVRHRQRHLVRSGDLAARAARLILEHVSTSISPPISRRF